jgi:putative peptide zinc metalloprotease protein
LRSKWQRAVVGLAGVMAEMAVAAVAAIVWAGTSVGTPHVIAYNVIFVAGVSTVLFNGNPLLRFDAYYVLTDLIEIPNLSRRARQYLFYLGQRYAWGLTRAWNPAFTTGERFWFVGYGITSSLYCLYIFIRIILFLNSRLPQPLLILVPILAFSGLMGWLLVPLGRFLHYLTTSEELARRRLRAGATTASVALILGAGLGLLRLPDYCRVEGIVEPQGLSIIYAQSDGYVTDVLPSQTPVSAQGPVLIDAVNPALEAERNSLLAQRLALEVRRSLAVTEEVATAQILDEQLAALDEKIARVQQELSLLHLTAPAAGTWVSPEIETARGRYLRRGEEIGVVARLDELMIRATAGQSTAAVIIEQAPKSVEIRAHQRPERTITGTIEKVFPAGQEQLPSQALGYAVGGSMPTDLRDPKGTRSAEMFFEIRIRPNLAQAERWLTGQRVIVRIPLCSKSLAAQAYHHGRQVFQRRFHI